ncbi:MAG: multicopper oxidase domain-containing protein [Chlorobi bacterium]|nr:multicopper oxidase domain-containing protein [Chlorobiota bacterium]
MKFFITLILLGISSLTYSQNQLIIPDTLDGTTFNLNLQYGTFQFYPGVNTSTMGVNGNILGPTLIMNQGDNVNITVNNQISDTTTIHWHGMHVSAENDGGPHTTIPPGTTWNPGFTVMDKAGTYWYHPHLHTKTNLHVSKGIAGFIIVRDDEEAAIDLPRTYGVDDFPLVIQTKTFDAAKEIVVPSNSDTVVMVNATIDAVLDVPAQVIRFRLLNGSSQRVFNFGLSGDMPFFQIASDGGLLDAPLVMTRLQLSPGERAEILVEFTDMVGQTVDLMSYASEFSNGVYGAAYPGMNSAQVLNGYNPNPMNGNDFNIMTFNVVAENSNPVTTIPSDLATIMPWDENDSNVTRDITITATQMGLNALNGDFLLNDSYFNMDVINYTIPFNNIEIWSITNNSPIGHPFHIHDVQFYILDRDGNVPPINEQGRKDVVFVHAMETVRFITKFEDFADDAVPYMYHCHMLTHEDRGMMGQFTVVDQVPVEFTSFYSTVDEGYVKLFWETATESNNKGFSIERSQNENDWNEIGFVNGNGTTLEPKRYSFIDNSPVSGAVSYRLKQIDFDGRFEYSDIIEVETSVPNKFSLSQNYPNPFNPSTVIDYSIAKAGNVSILVYNSLGETVLELVNEFLDAGGYSVAVNGAQLSSGVYYYRLQTDGFSSIKKMILLK